MSTTAPGFTEWGLAMGSVTAVRSFRIDGLGRLTGLSHRSVWQPGVNEAECQAGFNFPVVFNNVTLGPGSFFVGGSNPEEVSPVEQEHDLSTCTCGFYAYYDEHDDGDRMSGDVQAIVDLHGKAVMGSRGLRAEKGRIVALVRPKAAEPVKASRIVRWASVQGDEMLDRWAMGAAVAAGLAGVVGAGLASIPLVIGGFALMFAIAGIRFLLETQVDKYKATLILRTAFNRNNDHLFPTTVELYGVPVYDSIEAAVKAHPLTPPPPAPPAPTPQTDPDFWTRPVR